MTCPHFIATDSFFIETVQMSFFGPSAADKARMAAKTAARTTASAATRGIEDPAVTAKKQQLADLQAKYDKDMAALVAKKGTPGVDDLDNATEQADLRRRFNEDKADLGLGGRRRKTRGRRSRKSRSRRNRKTSRRKH